MTSLLKFWNSDVTVDDACELSQLMGQTEFLSTAIDRTNAVSKIRKWFLCMDICQKREENETNFKWNTTKTFMRQVLLIFICITDFSAPLRSKGGLCYTPGVVVRVCVCVSVSMCGSVSVSVTVSILVGVCCQVNQCFNAFTTYTLFRSFRTTQRDWLLYSPFTDTNCAFTD